MKGYTPSGEKITENRSQVDVKNITCRLTAMTQQHPHTHATMAYKAPKVTRRAQITINLAPLHLRKSVN